MKYLLFIILSVLFVFSSAYAKTIYVSSVKTCLYKDADRSSLEIMKLNKGDELSVITENNNWIKVACNGKTGWVQKLFTSPNKPDKKITLFGSEAKRARIYARKRASSDVTAASARGLMADDARGRVKASAEENLHNTELLTKIEKIYFSEEELMEFLKEGGITR